MTPDLYRLFTMQSGMLTHQWQGLFYPNLALGLLFSAIWYLLYRPVVYRFWYQHDLKLDSFRHFLAFYWNHNCSTHWYSNTSHLGWAYPLRL